MPKWGVTDIYLVSDKLFLMQNVRGFSMQVQLITFLVPLQNPTFHLGSLSPLASENEDQQSHDISATKDDKTKSMVSHTHTATHTYGHTHTYTHTHTHTNTHTHTWLDERADLHMDQKTTTSSSALVTCILCVLRHNSRC